MHKRGRQRGYLSHMTTDGDVLGCVVCLHVYLGGGGGGRGAAEAIFHLLR